MKIRPFVIDDDFDQIKDWIDNERSHAMWCANNVDYPMNKESFGELMQNVADKCGDIPYVATEDDGTVEGFFCYSTNPDTNEGMLKFVVVDPEQRGKGVAKQMLKLVVDKAFGNAKKAVNLMVFSENIRAKKCYESVGFIERETTPGAFSFKDESWGRCNMVITNEAV